jgi:hypothetical protein
MRLFVVALLAAGAITVAAAPAAHADGYIGFGYSSGCCYPGPVYAAPAYYAPPAYYAAPAYYYPRPAYYYPRPYWGPSWSVGFGYWGGGHRHHHHTHFHRGHRH